MKKLLTTMLAILGLGTGGIAHGMPFTTYHNQFQPSILLNGTYSGSFDLNSTIPTGGQYNSPYDVNSASITWYFTDDGDSSYTGGNSNYSSTYPNPPSEYDEIRYWSYNSYYTDASEQVATTVGGQTSFGNSAWYSNSPSSNGTPWTEHQSRVEQRCSGWPVTSCYPYSYDGYPFNAGQQSLSG